MANSALFQIIFYLLVVVLCVKPIGFYMARVFSGKSYGWNKILIPLESFIYRLCGINIDAAMDWKKYLFSILLLNFLGFLFVYGIQRLQFFIPFNPQHFTAVAPSLAFHTAISFVTNTNWQSYSGENSLGYCTQMMALTVQNFLSAATGLAVAVAFIRGLVRHGTTNLGNFWVDTVRSIVYILIPFSFVFAILLISQGVIQNLKPYQTEYLLQPITYLQTVTDSSGSPVLDKNGQAESVTQIVTQQQIPMGPAASQIAIKQLGSNGGGFFNANSAHPFENPTSISNFLELFAILILPASLTYTFGLMVRDKRQGWAIFVAMLIILLPLICMTVHVEQVGNPAFKQFGITQIAQDQLYAGGNMEGKEVRFGIVNSALWTTVTTATGNGSVNSTLDSYIPISGLVPLWLMHLSEVVFGGVGSGLYSMLMMVIITVFVAGLMVGRSPEYLGKKIESFEMKMASMAVLIMPLTVLLFTALTCVTHLRGVFVGNPGAHGFTEILYAFTSMVNNNGSSFAGLNTNTTYYNILGGIAMMIGRYWISIPILAIAGSLASKKVIPISPGTLPTHSALFIVLLLSIIIIFGALTFFPALFLGPIDEQLTLWSQYGY